MAELRARNKRQDRLSSLDLQYPLWIFDADDPRWPRRLASILPNSRPAKLTRWVVSFSEYAQHLTPLQDLSRRDEEVVQPASRSQNAKLAQNALVQLRYDDSYAADSLQVIHDDDNGEQTAKLLSSWIFDNHEQNWTDPANVLRIERIWDGVPLWDPKQGLTQLSDYDSKDAIFGVATLVANDDELLFASGNQETDSGEGIRKAEFQCLAAGDGGEFLQGAVCPPRWVEPGVQGLMLRSGPKDKHNSQLLAGTILQHAAWEDVVEYRKGLRRGPLWR
jgi:hypothetical protein